MESVSRRSSCGAAGVGGGSRDREEKMMNEQIMSELFRFVCLHRWAVIPLILVYLAVVWPASSVLEKKEVKG